MKGIVVEINKNDAVILTDDGLFTKAKNHNYAVGQAVTIRGGRKTYSKLAAGAVSMAAAFAVCTIGAYAWFTPTDYVSLDVNPSVEYSINMFDRILDVKAVNDDGEEILDGLDLVNMTIEAAVKETLDKLVADGYLTDDADGGVVITTSNDKMGDAEQLAAELGQKVQAYLAGQEGVTAEVDAHAVTPKRVEEAKKLGVTPGKLHLVEKLQASTIGAISAEEWVTKPVREINKAIKENRKAENDEDEWDDEPDSDDEDAVTQRETDRSRKDEKQDKDRPDGRDRTKVRDSSTNSGVRWNDQKPQGKNGRESEKIDRSSDQKTDEQEDDQQTDEDERDRGKSPKGGSRQGGGDSSDRDEDEND